MSITKAIIPVAGWGTRRLPITKAIEKCMLPIGNRPIVDYVVHDCVAAGITDIYFVVSEQSEQLHAFYRDNVELTDYLIRNGKQDMIPLTETPLARFHYIVQPSYGKYGTAVPVDLAMPYIHEGESVVVMMGDDCLYNADGSSDIARLLEATPEGQSAILAVPVHDDSIQRYGHVVADESGNLVRIIEHPDPMPDQFMKNVSKYVLNYSMLQAISAYVAQPIEAGREYYIFHPFQEVIASGNSMKVVAAHGQYLDAGTVEGWLHANQVVISDTNPASSL
ncbi:MAG: sugar phosphate nucleotidyltransferase [Candidatus Saccharimonadales bacterium]|jgi:UTP--glucose-1-phosphate uridylyltransferase